MNVYGERTLKRRPKMTLTNPLHRPLHLEIGASYLLRETGTHTPLAARATGLGYAPVTFVGYDSCPAFVFVRDAAGYVGRCPREDLFQAYTAGYQQTKNQPPITKIF
jgi:hypothetical protein